MRIWQYSYIASALKATVLQVAMPFYDISVIYTGNLRNTLYKYLFIRSWLDKVYSLSMLFSLMKDTDTLRKPYFINVMSR